MGADGSTPTRLTDDPTAELAPVWAPDGTRIAFLVRPEGTDAYGRLDLYVMQADGRDLHLVDSQFHSFAPPRWAPDGTHLVFASSRDTPHTVWLFVSHLDGQQPTALTPGETPTWDPDGRRLAFSIPTDNGYQVGVVNADGTNRTQLTFERYSSLPATPVWAPDGRRIAFEAYRRDTFGLAVINPDGSGLHQLTESPGAGPVGDRDLDWAPDSQSLAFTRVTGIGDPGSVYLINADGTGLRRLEYGREPTWQPHP